MSDAFDILLEEIARNTGRIQRWEARAEARAEEAKAIRIAKNLLAEGFSAEQTAKLAELDLEKVRALA